MFKKNKQKKKKKKVDLFETYTKTMVTIIMIIALIDLQITYVLAYFDKIQIAETLSTAIVTEIIGVIAVYMLKAFFETFAEKRNEIKLGKIVNEINNDLEETEEVLDENISEDDNSEKGM